MRLMMTKTPGNVNVFIIPALCATSGKLFVYRILGCYAGKNNSQIQLHKRLVSRNTLTFCPTFYLINLNDWL